MSRTGVFLVVSRSRSVPCRDIPMTKQQSRQILTRRPRCIAINNLGASLSESSTKMIFGFYAQQALLIKVYAIQGIEGRIIRSHDTFGDDHADVGQLQQTQNERITAMALHPPYA